MNLITIFFPFFFLAVGRKTLEEDLNINNSIFVVSGGKMNEKTEKKMKLENLLNIKSGLERYEYKIKRHISVMKFFFQ